MNESRSLTVCCSYVLWFLGRAENQPWLFRIFCPHKSVDSSPTGFDDQTTAKRDLISSRGRSEMPECAKKIDWSNR